MRAALHSFDLLRLRRRTQTPGGRVPIEVELLERIEDEANAPTPDWDEVRRLSGELADLIGEAFGE